LDWAASTVTYPVIYLLDAEDHFDITFALVNELAKNDKMPNHILVGIPKIDNLIRFKNLTFSKENPLDYDTLINPAFFNNPENFGGGREFLKYIENELIPFVNKKYNTNGYNILIGHSLGGYFGAYSIPIQKSFSAFQLYDPSVFCNSNEAIKNIEENLKLDYSTNVFISYALAKNEGDQRGKKIALNAIDTLIERISNYPKIRLDSKFYTDEGHLSMYMYSLIDGFTFLYKGFEFGFIMPTMNISIEEYSAHYEKLSKTTGFNFSPPIAGIRWVAYANYHQKKWKEAVKSYLLCEQYFVNDYQVNLEIAECYLNLNEIKLSLKYYTICKGLNPNNNGINEKINELKLKLNY
jgi:predicted alpha/beta superfamily hydrolase